MDDLLWYKNARLGERLVDIEVCNGKISAIGKTRCDGIDLQGRDVFPGLIDIHCHGALEYDAYEGNSDEEGLEIMSLYFAKNGITTWYPSTGGSKEEILHMLNQSLAG